MMSLLIELIGFVAKIDVLQIGAWLAPQHRSLGRISPSPFLPLS